MNESSKCNAIAIILYTKNVINAYNSGNFIVFYQLCYISGIIISSNQSLYSCIINHYITETTLWIQDKQVIHVEVNSCKISNYDYSRRREELIIKYELQIYIKTDLRL